MHKRTGLAVIALLSITATFATGLIANADETSANNDITITAPAGGTNLIAPTVDGRTFKAIRIAGYKDVAVKDGKITGFDLTLADGVTDSALTTAILAAYPSGVESVFTVTDGKITLQGAYENMTLIQFIGQYFYGNGSDVYGNTNAGSEAVRKLADSLMGSLSSNPAITAIGSEGKVVIDVPDDREGLYLIVEEPKIDTTTDAFKGETVSRAMLTGTGATVDGTIYTQVSTKHGDTDVTYTLGALNLKAEKVTLDKEVEHPDQLIQIGTSRQFTITTNVPNYQTDYPTWTPTTFQFTDNPSDNIDPFNTDGTVRNLKLQSSNDGGTTWTDMVASEYTQAKNTTTEDSNDFIVALTPAALIAHQGERIKLTYDGVITSLKMDTADDDAHTTLNTVDLDFSNNPNVADDKARLTDDVNLYDVKLDIEKTDMQTRKLLGARFDVTVGGTKIKFIKSANGDQYTAVKAGSAQDANSVDSISVGYDDNGTVKPVTINGLAADNSGATVYTFTETQAPEGYILGANPVTFTVTLTPKDANSDGTVDGVDAAVNAGTFGNFVVNGTSNTNAPVSGHEFNVGQVTVKNTKNISDLPQTGGTISKAIGAALATGAFATLLIVGVKLRRKQMSDENGSTSSMA
ncbi:isopeptide-forming domain-containing fimbrial protein [Bifidobacterium pseudolongum]|uniref:isopeptide-forming domain-containing fimbrial protein n=1 Tax=Bifidobacterium pseudolongum TaxID=1694 RepID=UPI0005001697|nr:isopeptide-forming domain-containing fimbrial protein [Bifidobacterium pseudolongum]KFI80545.1 fimbrial subunit FimA [Bifidobacterium pseudolongum subsp. globosum]UBY94527.1 isopeptide-forming domain-containing fimbrial protein [Bifidobacterium pseudolongum]UBZ03360.1 isopeptide-forming domain-containing fimbrial protein [Bifidobacterium pseudolongum]UBZ04935.1 isopeptide-forming domain-containing fimbrial protein [Bifidobacterium pseudolongum]UDL23945.1 isopeptide-forming domain-containing